MFNVCDNRGFQIGFSNGYVVSCQFGTTHYCSRRDYDSSKIFSERNQSIVKSDDCEVAIICKDNTRGIDGFVTGEIIDAMGLDIGGDGMVAGWVSADDVGKIIAYVSTLEG